MKKHGFTLIELIGVITILGILVLIVSPIVRGVTENSKETLFEAQIESIKDGLKNWSIANAQSLPQEEGASITITLGQLKTDGFIDINLKNPKNNKCFNNDMILTITRYQKNYIYGVNYEENSETNECSDYTQDIS